MTDRRMVQEVLPPLPDDLDEARSAKLEAEARTSAAKAQGQEVYSLASTLVDLKRHNGFGSLLMDNYRLRILDAWHSPAN